MKAWRSKIRAQRAARRGGPQTRFTAVKYQLLQPYSRETHPLFLALLRALVLAALWLVAFAVRAEGGENILKVARRTTQGINNVSTKSYGFTYQQDVLPILMGKCARCHNPQSEVLQNWFDYKTASSKRWEIKRRVWDSWKGE